MTKMKMTRKTKKKKMMTMKKKLQYGQIAGGFTQSQTPHDIDKHVQTPDRQSTTLGENGQEQGKADLRARH